MQEFYLFFVILLFVLAISDLIVGVSNDAVNFLNSAIGSKVATRRTIMIVASLGIFAGATFSSGMMEVARKGIFNPEYFYFSEIMIVFLAVMLTDIILLDLFNTFGLPTSTTVSIVFELLGASVMMAIIKINANGQALSDLGMYINSSKAITIILGIFLSVVFAFVIGGIVQLGSRLLFSFQYEKKIKVVGSIWSGLALAGLTFFLLFKGIKGASFVSQSFIEWVAQHTILLLTIAFGFWTIIMAILAQRGVNIFRIVVLFGTFALAMAFAGNDLVNFIGVPIAGYESYLAWAASGVDATQYDMSILQEPVRTKSFLLVTAGLIMIITLWLSKKARSVTETEVNLGRQDEGYERFSPHGLARGIVQISSSFSKIVLSVIPVRWQKRMNSNFSRTKKKTDKDVAFDMIRASVNLTTASMLIAFATSLKLPLSTTYVSFMVAMGSSLADKAWGRDSAVFRVSGVLNVIAGWFATALIAFTAAALFVTAIYYLRIGAVIALLTLAVFFIFRSFRYHRKREEKKKRRIAFENLSSSIRVSELLQEFSIRIGLLLRTIRTSYHHTLTGLIEEDQNLLNKLKKRIRELEFKNEEFQYQIYGSIKRMEEQDSEGSRTFILLYDLEQDIIQSMGYIIRKSGLHVANGLKPLAHHQIHNLQMVLFSLDSYFFLIEAFLHNPQKQTWKEIKKEKNEIYLSIEKLLADQAQGIKTSKYSARNSLLFFSLLLETKDIIAISSHFAKLFYRVVYKTSKGYQALVASDEEIPEEILAPK